MGICINLIYSVLYQTSSAVMQQLTRVGDNGTLNFEWVILI